MEDVSLSHIKDLVTYLEHFKIIIHDILMGRTDEDTWIRFFRNTNFCKECVEGQQQMMLVPCGHLICNDCESRSNSICPFCGERNVFGVWLTYKLIKSMKVKWD